MALLASHRIAGIIPIASSIDSESQRTTTLGCWDAFKELTPRINALTSVDVTPEFNAPESFLDDLICMGLGADCGDDVRELWM